MQAYQKKKQAYQKMTINLQIPVPRFTESAHKWQREVIAAFNRGRYTPGYMQRYFWLNWHRRARKTTLGLNIIVKEAIINPRHIYDFVGPTYKQVKMIVLRDPDMLMPFLPDKDTFNWTLNKTDLYIELQNKTIINFKGADDPDSLRGPKANGVWFDEWSLMDPEVVWAVYRPMLAEDPKRWAGFGFTPKGQNHAYEGLNKAKRKRNSFVSELNAEDSGIILASELAEAKEEMPPELFQQEFMCSFIAEEEMTFITSAALDVLRGIIHLPDRTKTFIAVDPATGGDECVAKVFINTKEVDQAIYHHRDEMKIVAELQSLAMRNNTRNFVIESIGLGGGIASRLREIGYNVHNFEPGGSACDKEHYANAKAEMWWEVSKLVRDGKTEYPEDLETRRQISSVKYKMQSNSGRLICEPKDMTKKRLGHSPDRADAWVIGIHHKDVFEFDDHINTGRHSVPDYIQAGVG